MANIFSGSNMFDSNGNPIYGNTSGGHVFTTTTSTTVGPNGFAGMVGSRGSEQPLDAHTYKCEACGHENLHSFNKESYCHLCNEKHEC